MASRSRVRPVAVVGPRRERDGGVVPGASQPRGHGQHGPQHAARRAGRPSSAASPAPADAARRDRFPWPRRRRTAPTAAGPTPRRRRRGRPAAVAAARDHVAVPSRTYRATTAGDEQGGGEEQVADVHLHAQRADDHGHGRARAWPATTAHTSTRKPKNASTRMFGRHTSNSSSLPRVHARTAVATRGGQGRRRIRRSRRATSTLPQTAATLRTAAATAKPSGRRSSARGRRSSRTAAVPGG